MRIANDMKKKQVSVRELFDELIAEAEIDGEVIEVLTQISFFEGLSALDMEFSEIEMECVLAILCKPQLENCLLYDELEKIIENFDSYEEDDLKKNPLGKTPPKAAGVGGKSESSSKKPSPIQSAQPSPQKKKNVENSAAPPAANDDKNKKKKLDYDQLDDKSILILYKLQKQIEKKGNDVIKFFQQIVYKKLIVTSKKEENVEVINTDDFFSLLSDNGIVKKAKPHDNLHKFLLLKATIPELLFFKKVKKTLKDLVSVEELKGRVNSLVNAKKAEKKGKKKDVRDLVNFRIMVQKGGIKKKDLQNTDLIQSKKKTNILILILIPKISI